MYHWLLALTSASPLWGGIVVLFLIAYWRKRRRARLVITGWEAQERAEVAVQYSRTDDGVDLEIEEEEDAEEQPPRKKIIRRRRFASIRRRE